MIDSGRVEVIVEVSPHELIDYNLEGFLDLISERAGHPVLTDIGYEFQTLNEEGMLEVLVTGFCDDEDCEDEDHEWNTVNCYFCGREVIDREAMSADPYNNNDGGSICWQCEAEKRRAKRLEGQNEGVEL